MTATSELSARSIEDLQADLRSGKVTAVGLAERAIENYAAHGETLNIYKTWDPESLRAQAEVADAAFAADMDFGPMQGLPISVKDLYGVSGYPTFAGTPSQMPPKYEREGPVVRSLRQGLATVTGKTHTVEFAFGGVGSNPHWGTPRNPWDADRHRAPGGSSSGAGVSLWAGTAVAALGSDTAGSVRVPASVTGTVGIKTSMHRWSLDGIVPLSPSLDTAGVLTRSAADAAIAFAVIDPLVDEHPLAFLDRLRDLETADIHVGVCDWFFDDADPSVAQAVRDTIAELEKAGMTAVNLDLPTVAASHEIFKRGGLAAPEFTAFINSEMADRKATLDPNVAARFERMEAIPASDYLIRKQELELLAAETTELMASVDVALTPTVAITPPDLEDAKPGDPYLTANMGMLRNTAPMNLLRLCGVSLPAALDDAGMPVGLQIIAPYGEDERAIAIACAFERTLGTARERLGTPPLCSN